MRAKQNQSSNIGLEQKNSLIQAWINLKDSIFNVLFVLLQRNDQDEQQSVWGLALESGVDYLQMMAFPFDVAVISVWNGGETLQNVTVLFEKFNISSYLPGVSFGPFLILLYSLIFLIILVILDIIYVSYSFSKKKFRFTWPLVLLAQIVPLFVTVFFLPMTETLLSVVQCQTAENQEYQVMISFPDVICWEGWHLFHAAVTLLFVSIFVFISSVVALALFEPRMTTNKLTARQNSTAQVVFIMNKIVCQFIFSFTPFDETWIYCVMLFAFAFWQFWCYTVNEPYYSKKATKFFKIVSTYYFWTILMLMVSQILTIYDFSGGLVIWLGGLPFLFIIILFERKSNIGKLFASNLKFRNGEELESHITYVLQLIQNQKKDKNSYMLLIGYIEKHKQICTQQDCPFSKYLKKKKKYGENEMQDNCIQLLKQLERMYRMGIKKYPNCTKLRLSFAFFHLQRTKNKNKAFEQFTNAEQTDPSFQEQFIIYRFKKIIRQNLQDDDKGGSSDLIEMIRFDNHISLCQQAMVTSARLHKQFWAQLKQQIPNLKKLNSIGSKITQTGNAVKQNFNQISKINSSVPQILHSYAVYLLLIIEDYAEGRQILANSKKLYQDKLSGEDKGKDNGDYDGFNDRVLSPVIVISRNDDKLGKIINSNLMLTEITGYYKEELCDRDFHKLLPETYVAAHQHTLNEWAKKQNATSSYFSASNEGFLKQKSGFIVPVIYSVRYNIVQEEFVAQFRLDTSKTTKSILLADSMGLIKEYSNVAKHYLKFQGNTVESTSLYLQQLNITNYDNDQYKNGIRRNLAISNNQEKSSVVKITPITMFASPSDFQQNSVSDELLSTTKQTIGYIVQITPAISFEKSSKQLESTKNLNKDDINSSKRLFVSSNNLQVVNKPFKTNSFQHSEQDLSNQNLDLNPDLMDLYRGPQISEIYLSKLNQSKKQQVVLRQFQLKQKIKTMRLLDNQIKMVYNQTSQNDYSANHQLNDLEQQTEMFKFHDSSYQIKLRKAINTNINHHQIVQLKYVSIIFMLILFIVISMQLLFSIQNLRMIEDYSTNIRSKSNEMYHLSKYITGTIDPLYSNQTYFDQMYKYNITWETNKDIYIKLENRQDLELKNLKDVLILIHSKLLEYYSATSSKLYTLDNVYYNFVNFIYPAFINSSDQINIHKVIPYSFFFIVILITLFMIGFWIYVSLQLDKKKYDIMIWFLDIPIPYVSHLSIHCDKYLKQYIGIKELMEKQQTFNIEEIDQNQYEQYDQLKNQNKEQEIEEQIKARKSLIAKHRKQTLLSKLNFGYIKLSWLLFYATLISVLLIISTQLQYQNYEFLYPQWKVTSNQVFRNSALNIALKLLQKNQTIGNVNIASMVDELKQDNINQITFSHMNQFNKQMLDYNSDISDYFELIYFDTLCRLPSYNATYIQECRQMIDGKMRVGYNVYSKYVASAPFEERNTIRKANENYAIPALVFMLQAWQNTIKSSIEGSINLCSIMLYVYVILTVFGFLVFWMMHLKKMNTQLNQTIQMLNMIPFKLLPKSRRQTRQFITWIIKQSNKKRHESQ